MKQTGGEKRPPLLVVRIGVVAPPLAHVLGVVLTWVMFFFIRRGSLPTQHREELQGDNLNLHFSRENFEGLEQTKEYLSHNMRVTRFQCNICIYQFINEGRE